MLKRETREQVGLKPPKNRRYDVNKKGVAIHWPGAKANFRQMTHAQHQAFVRNWQAMHMDRGSNDLEYGSLICPCGIWMEGRTEFDKPMVRVGSNGNAQANADYTSVQLMLGNREQITRQEVAWLGEAVAWLRSQGWGRAVVGHRDLSQTTCPGDSIYAALPQIRQAADQPAQQAPAPEEEDPVVIVFIQHKGKRYVSYPASGRLRELRDQQQEQDIRYWYGKIGARIIDYPEKGKDVGYLSPFGVLQD